MKAKFFLVLVCSSFLVTELEADLSDYEAAIPTPDGPKKAVRIQPVATTSAPKQTQSFTTRRPEVRTNRPTSTYQPPSSVYQTGNNLPGYNIVKSHSSSSNSTKHCTKNVCTTTTCENGRCTTTHSNWDQSDSDSSPSTTRQTPIYRINEGYTYSSSSSSSGKTTCSNGWCTKKVCVNGSCETTTYWNND